MKHTFLIAGLVGLLLLTVAGAALAAPPNPPPVRGHGNPPVTPATDQGMGKRHGLFGTVKSKATGSFVVTTKQGDVGVTVTDKTRFQIPTKRDASFADLLVGARVAVNGTPTDGGLTAKKVSIAPGKPSVQHRVGEVTAYTAKASITIKTKQGETATFALTAQTVIRNDQGAGVKKGDTVTVVSRRDPSTDVFTASAIVVHPKPE